MLNIVDFVVVTLFLLFAYIVVLVAGRKIGYLDCKISLLKISEKIGITTEEQWIKFENLLDNV